MRLALLLAAVLATACQVTKDIQILSEPEGARIIINDDYVGETPLTFTVGLDYNWWGTGGYKWSTYHIEALPTDGMEGVSGQVRKRTIKFRSEDRIPSRVFFDMDLKSTYSGPSTVIEMPIEPLWPLLLPPLLPPAPCPPQSLWTVPI